MKNNSQNKKADSPLHIQDLAHSRKRTTRVILKFFVWILIISFVTTIGVTWGGGSNSYGNIVSTKNTKLDLSPGGFFIREREAVYNNIAGQNTNADPRMLNDYVNKAAIRRGEALALRNDFLQEVKIAPSAEMAETLRRNTGIAAPAMISYYYGAQTLFSQLGLLAILGEPTIADVYAVNDVSRLQIAAEGLMFSVTNFYAAKVSPEEKEAFYAKEAGRWADRVVAASFTTDSRSNAFELAKVISNAGSFAEGIKAATNLISSKGRWSNSSYKDQELTRPEPATIELFRAGVSAFKNRGALDYAVSAPVYKGGRYTVLVVTSTGSYEALGYLEKQMLHADLVSKNYKELNRKYRTEWTAAVETLKKGISENKAFAEFAQTIPGLRVDASMPFNPLSEAAIGALGDMFIAPVLQDSRLMSSLLISKKPELIADRDNADTYYAVRALDIKAPTPEELQINPAAAIADMQMLQNLYGFRTAMLDQGLTFGLKKRYNLKRNSAMLTNFIATE